MDELRAGVMFDPSRYFSPVTQVKEFFLARQPILDPNQNFVAYELSFRR